MTDEERLDWLEADPERLELVQDYLVDRSGSDIREAIDWLRYHP